MIYDVSMNAVMLTGRFRHRPSGETGWYLKVETDRWPVAAVSQITDLSEHSSEGKNNDQFDGSELVPF